MNNTPFVTVLGTADCLPAKGNDGANYIIGDKIKLDMGWFSVGSMLEMGLNPLDADTVLLTHMHTDHTMSLAHLLMYCWVVRGSVNSLTIVGPAEQLRGRYEAAYDFAFWEYPELRRNKAFGEAKLIEWQGGENAVFGDYSVFSTSSMHALPGLCYKLVHNDTGHSVGFSGDTMYQAKYAEFFADCNLLFYECSWGEGPLDEKLNSECKHSSVYEAVKVAEECRAKQLLLTHCRTEKQPKALEKANEIATVPTRFAKPFETITF